MEKNKSEKKFKKDILVKYLYYKYNCDDKNQYVSTSKRVDIRIEFCSIFFTLLSYKKNNIKLKYAFNNIYYNIEDLDNTYDNLYDNKIYDKTDRYVINENNIKNYLDFFFIELFGEYKTDKKKVDNYNFDRNKFKQYFNQEIFNEEEDKYNSDDITYSKKEMKEKEDEIKEKEDEIKEKEDEIKEKENEIEDLEAEIQ